MREVLYDVQWQLIRINMLKDRQVNGGWAMSRGIWDNLDNLGEYVMDAKGDEHEVRKYRVHNCLNAVVMGYHGQKSPAEYIARVRRWRETYVRDWDSFAIHEAADKWDWEKVELDLSHIKSGGEYAFLYKDLKKRAQNGSERTRPELHKFLGLMDKVFPNWVETKRIMNKSK